MSACFWSEGVYEHLEDTSEIVVQIVLSGKEKCVVSLISTYPKVWWEGRGLINRLGRRIAAVLDGSAIHNIALNLERVATGGG